MRTLRFTPLLALLLLVFAAPQTTRAASAAAGSYQFTLAGDKYLKYVEFDARALDNGGATGYIKLTDEAVIVLRDVDGDGSPEEKFAGYYLTADVDGLVVTENKAVLSATIRDASRQEFIGQRVLLTVKDGEPVREPDELTWGMYREIRRDWVPSDAEWKEDPGVGLRWWARDAERRDDVGYEMPRDERIGTTTFPFAAYGFVLTDSAAGDIRVTP
jgi:hypothetical protein